MQTARDLEERRIGTLRSEPVQGSSRARTQDPSPTEPPSQKVPTYFAIQSSGYPVGSATLSIKEDPLPQIYEVSKKTFLFVASCVIPQLNFIRIELFSTLL